MQVCMDCIAFLWAFIYMLTITSLSTTFLFEIALKKTPNKQYVPNKGNNNTPLKLVWTCRWVTYRSVGSFCLEVFEIWLNAFKV